MAPPTIQAGYGEHFFTNIGEKVQIEAQSIAQPPRTLKRDCRKPPFCQEPINRLFHFLSPFPKL